MFSVHHVPSLYCELTNEYYDKSGFKNDNGVTTMFSGSKAHQEHLEHCQESYFGESDNLYLKMNFGKQY